MNENTRERLVGVMSSVLSINPNLVARDGADSDGYRVFTPGITYTGERATKRVEWTGEQLAVIAEHQELFDVWFAESA